MAEYTLVTGDKIKDLVEVDPTTGTVTKTTTVTREDGSGGPYESTRGAIADQAAKAKDHLDDSEVTVTHNEDNEITGISYEKTKG
jgi:hypothetical protein